MIHKSDEGKREPITLEQNISIPSDVHGYCLAIEYMKDWFLSKFDKEFFKTVFVQGKNVMDDFRRFNREKILTIEKPALSITPSVNHEYDRDTVDLNLGGSDVLIRRSSVYDDAFFQDRENNIFIGIQLKQLEMRFAFNVRVNTRAEQLDLVKYIRMKCRVKATQYKYMNLDYHIPLDIMLSIARLRGFEVKDGKVTDIVGFLAYVNAHSFLPVVYKYRTINGRSEFFLKTENNYVWISCLDDLDIDDGQQVNQIWTNFHVQLNTTMRIPTPDIFYYYSKDLIDTTYERVTSTMEAMYTYKTIEPPERNDKGWDQYLSTEWEEESHNLTTIPFEELLQGGRLLEVMKHTIAMGISPSVFLDVELYNGYSRVDYTLDWDKIELVINKKVPEDITKLTIYIDKGFMNQQIQNIDGDKTRMSPSQNEMGTV